ncbi:MAG TPA: GNAT family N-acetyltransferase [Thermoanaerobaculia bacterium]
MSSPESVVLLGRIQDQMRAVALRQYEAVSVPPFMLFFHATDPLLFFNYAIPDAAAAPPGDLAAPLARLRAEFAARRRVPRFEFVEACAPSLSTALETHGFILENRARLMVCARGSERAAPAPAGLDVVTLDEGTPLEEFALFLDVQRLAFGFPSPKPATHEDALSLSRSLGDGFALMGRIGGRTVATAMIQPGRDGLAELVGVATLEEFRRRGIGGALSFEAVRRAFERGLSLVFLSAADARAGRVYEAAGFSAAGDCLFYLSPQDAEPAIEVREATEPGLLEAARALILGHAAGLGDVPGVVRVRADAASLPGPYGPPEGALLVAALAGNPAGCVAFKKLDDATCEVKRMFVDPAFRKKGVARALMLRLLEEASRRGYRRVRLGTLHTMTAAQALYRDLGFVEIPRYRPDEHTDTMFFEKNLS